MLPLGADDPSAQVPLCPWHELAPEASSVGVDGNLMAGGMVWVPDHREFILVGGVAEDAGTRWTVSTVATLALEDLEDGAAAFDGLSELPDSEAKVRIDASGGDGDPETKADCQRVGSFVCVGLDDDDECEIRWQETFDRCVNTWTAPEDCGDDVDAEDTYEGAFPACADDPFCTYGEELNEVALVSSGRAKAAITYDPVDDRIRVLGGYSGCSGEDCANWSDLYIEAQSDTDNWLAALLPAHDLVLTPGSGATETSWAATTSLYSAATLWPEGATRGLSGAAAVSMGLQFDLSTRTYVREGAADTTYVGGSIHRGVAIQQALDFPLQTEQLMAGGKVCYTGNPLEEPGEWFVTQAAVDMDDGLTHANVSVGTVSTGSTSTWSPLSTSPTVSARRDAAATAIDADRLLVVGGQGAGGADDVLLIDRVTGAASMIDESTNRYGATVVYDPFAGRSVIFGGSESSEVTLVAIDDDPTTLNDGSTWEMGTSAVSLVQDTEELDTWQVQQQFTVTHSCQDGEGGTRCGASLGTLYLPTIAQTDLETLDVTLVYDDGLTVRPRVVDFGADEYFYVVELRLPRVVADGEELDLTISYDAHAENRGTVSGLRDADTLRGLKSFAFGDDARRGWLLDALPSWWGTGLGADDSFNQQVSATWTVVPAVDAAVVGAGRLVDPTSLPAELEDGPTVQPIDHTVMVLEGVSYIGDEVLSATSTVVHVFFDDGIDSAQMAALTSYASGGLADDLSWLEDRLGSHPLGYAHLVYLRQPAASMDNVGWSAHGYHLVNRVSANGSAWYDGAAGADSGVAWQTTVHELAHAWWGVGLTFDTSERWLQEGIPELLTASRYPDAWLSSVDTVRGVEPIIQAMASGARLGIDLDSASTTLIYTTSTYILLQAWLLHMGEGSTDDAFWSELRSVTSGLTYDEQVDATLLEDLLNGWAGFTGFYGTFVVKGALSIPMVALTALDLPAVESGDTGDTGAGSDPGSYTIQQVQGEMFGVSSWGVAPYVLSCSDADDPSVVTLDECVMSRPDVSAEWAVVPSILEGAVMEGSPTISAVGSGELDLRWQMFAGPNLVNMGGNVGVLASHFGAGTPLLRCAPDSLRSACLTDGDSDGHVDEGDCDMGEPTIHPLWISDEEAPCASSTTDHNCDGWTCPL